MNGALPPQPEHVETIAELRALYRAAETRASRLRLLSSIGKELAAAELATVEGTLLECATRLAFFAGFASGGVVTEPDVSGIAISAPGQGGVVAVLQIPGLSSLDDIVDDEDRDAVQMAVDLIGVTIDRMNRDRDRIELLAKLQEREARLEALVAGTFNAQEEERRRVSRDLHDGVAQTATALFRMLEGSGGNSSEPLPADARRQLAEISRDLVSELRAVIAGLRPTILDDLGLEASVKALAEGMRSKGYTVTTSIQQAGERPPSIVETALYRVAQEAVTNILKHAGGPCRVFVELSFDPLTGTVLSIEDQGKAVSEKRAKPAFTEGEHVGIYGMRERMTILGGELVWRSRKAGGVCVTAKVPRTIAP